jgi:hypothetical protein
MLSHSLCADKMRAVTAAFETIGTTAGKTVMNATNLIGTPLGDNDFWCVGLKKCPPPLSLHPAGGGGGNARPHEITFFLQPSLRFLPIACLRNIDACV